MTAIGGPDARVLSLSIRFRCRRRAGQRGFPHRRSVAFSLPGAGRFVSTLFRAGGDATSGSHSSHHLRIVYGRRSPISSSDAGRSPVLTPRRSGSPTRSMPLRSKASLEDDESRGRSVFLIRGASHARRKRQYPRPAIDRISSDNPMDVRLGTVFMTGSFGSLGSEPALTSAPSLIPSPSESSGGRVCPGGYAPLSRFRRSA